MRPSRELKPNELRDHLANERTFLAWIRTAITIVALGFVISKSDPLLQSVSGKHTHGLGGNSSVVIGAIVVFTGLVTAAMASFRFLQVRSDINNSIVRFSPWLDLILAAMVLTTSVIVLIYVVVTT